MMYAVNDENNIVNYLKGAAATFYVFGGEQKEVRF